MAGYLGQSITEFVAGILEKETSQMKPSHDAVKLWYETRKRQREGEALDLATDSRKAEMQQDAQQIGAAGTSKVPRRQKNR